MEWQTLVVTREIDEKSGRIGFDYDGLIEVQPRRLVGFDCLVLKGWMLSWIGWL